MCVLAVRILYLIVIGILVGVVAVENALLITGIIICACYCWRKRKKSKKLDKNIKDLPQDTYQIC